VKGNIFYYIQLKATILNYFSTLVAIQIEALIITVHKLITSIVIEFCRLRLQPLIHACLQFCVVIEALCCEPGLHVWKQVVGARRKIRTVWRMIKHLPSKMIQELSSAIGCVRAGVVMKKQNLGTQFSLTLVLSRSS